MTWGGHVSCECRGLFWPERIEDSWAGQSLSRSMRLGVTQQYIPTLEKFRAFWTLEDHIGMHAAFMSLHASLGGESLVTDSALEIYRKVMIQIITEFTETHIGDY